MDEVNFKLRPIGEKPKKGSEQGDNTIMWIVFNTKKQGLETIMRDHTVIAMRFLWGNGKEGAISREIWLHANKILMKEKGKSISRASIINSMNDMVDAGVLNYKEKPGKGGYHRVYYPAFDEEGFKLHVVKKIISKLSDTWPDATKKALTASRKV